MDSRRYQKAKKKGKEKLPEGADKRANSSKRGDNWKSHETTNLINAIDQVQSRRGEVGFSFTSTEHQEIYNLFMQGIPNSKRDKEKIINRIKVIKSMFKICDDLAKRSGGGWDDATHRPIAASEKEYEEMVLAKGDNGRFLLKNNFPWYRKMEAMVRGQAAEGAQISETWAGDDPIHFLMDSQMSIHVSSQGSSDSPKEDSAYRSTERQQNPNASVPRSGSSGSKRRSTDESSEPNVRGKRYKERNRNRQNVVLELAQVGLKLADKMEADTKALTANSEEESASLAKLRDLGLSEEEHDFWFNLLEHSSYKRKWFIMHERETILKFYRREVLRSTSESIPRPMPSAYSGTNQGFPQPNPAANAAYNPFYPPPNPAATNFFFRPNDPNHGM